MAEATILPGIAAAEAKGPISDLGDKIGERFTSLLKASKNLPGKILLNLKESTAAGGRESGSGEASGDAGFASASYAMHEERPAGGGGVSNLFSMQSSESGLKHGLGTGAQVDSSGMGASGGTNGLGSCVGNAGGTSTSGGTAAGQYTDTGSGGAGANMPGTSPLPTPPRARAVVSGHRLNKFYKLLEKPVIDLDALQELSWNGIPAELRPVCWRLLMGYMPPNKARQAVTLGRKRQEYAEMVPQYYDISNSERSEEELTALRQVVLDVPRTAPTVPFFHEPQIQKSLERLLYIWGIRHPASGYVQGMNDLVTPFLAIFLGEHLPGPIEAWQAEQLAEDMLLQVEADCYWCLCKLVEAIQDHYTYAQPGIQRTVFRIHQVVRSAAPPLAQRLEEESIDFIQFAWRWVNCLLIREVPFELSFRLWDTYLAEGSHKFAEFLVYACAAFLVMWRRELEPMEFQDMIMFLQKPPTGEWREAQLEGVLGQAFILRNQYSAAHLRSK